MTDSAPADWDSPWKESLTVSLRWFLAMFFPQAHQEIDWSRGFEALDKELLKIAPAAQTGRRTVDLLFKVWLLTGEERWVLVHIKVQSQRDSDFPQRVYVYHYRIRDYYDRPVASFAILSDNERNWKPSSYSYDLWGCRCAFHFPIVKLLDFAGREEELERLDNPFAVVVLAHLKAKETADDRLRRRQWKVRLLKGLYNRGWERHDVRELLKMIDWFLTLPRDDDRLAYEEVEADQKEKRMPYVTSFERIAAERAEARGQAIGEARGQEIGEAHGRAEGLKVGIAIALRLKFAGAAEMLMAEVRQLTDIQTLDRIAASIEASAKPEDLRRVWAGD